MEKPLVSISVVTYNHKKYIKECLDSILMQQTTFPFEIILGEDESNDGTREICKAYADKHSDKIIMFLRSRKDVIYINNNATGRFNMIENLRTCKGKYIALCEGDDYWTDPLKLQKQVDFLEANPEYGICFHNVCVENGFNNKIHIIPDVKEDIDFTINDYVLNNKTATCSIVFRKDVFNGGIPEWLSKLPFGDLALILLALKKYNGKGHVLSDVMGVYRIHQEGIHGSLFKNKEGLIKAYKQHLKFTKHVKKYLLFEPKYKHIIGKKMMNTYDIISKLHMKNGNGLKFSGYIFLKNFYRLKMKFNR